MLALMYFVMKMIWFVLFIYQIKKFEKCIDLLLITNENKLLYVYIKDSNRFMCNKTKNKSKKHFSDIVYNILAAKKSCKNTKKFV